jgi:hypothetical protein
LGPLATAANPKGFWEQIKHDKDGIDIFLAAGIVTEGLSVGLEGFGLSAFVRNLSLRARFATRLVVDSGLAVGQGVASGADRGFNHFNWTSFAQNVELAGGGLAYSRGAVGEGYNPYTLRASDVTRMVEKAGDDRVLIFRERTPLRAFKGSPVSLTSPLTEKLKISAYHERILAISKADSSTTEVVVNGKTGVGYRKYGEFVDSSNSRFEFVGEAERTRQFNRKFWRSNPRNFPGETVLKYPQLAQGKSEYSVLTNNCHYHAQGVLVDLGLQ